MQITQLMSYIKDNKIPHFLIFYGEEYEVMNIYIKHIISSVFERKIISTTLLANNETNKKSLVNKRKCYIVYNDEDFVKQESKWEQVVSNFNTSNNMIILKYNKLDKRSKFYKQMQSYIVEFDTLSDNVLLSYLGEDFTEDVGLKLIDICEHNYGRMLLEVNKIRTYYTATKVKTSINDICSKFIKDGTIHQDIGDITFLLTDSILVGDMDNVNKLLYQAKIKGEPTIMVLSILYDNFKNMLIVQGLGKEKPTEHNTGIKNNVLWAIKKKCGTYSNSELLRNLKIIRDVEVGIKTGTIDQDIALEYAVLNILN